MNRILVKFFDILQKDMGNARYTKSEKKYTENIRYSNTLYKELLNSVEFE